MRSSRACRVRRATAVAAFVGLLISASSVRAEDKPAAAAQAGGRAEDLFGASADAYRRGDFKTAIELLQKVYALDPEPSILYNIGRAYEGLGDLQAAVDNYKKFLEQQPKARDRGALEQRITTLERQIAERSGLERQRDEERVRAADEARERAAKEAELARANEQQRKQQRRSPLPWIVGGVGVAGLAAGTVFAVMASSSHNDATTERQQQKAADLDASASNQATIANVAFIAGGVLVAGGVAWWWLDGRSKRTGAVTAWQLGVGPGFVGAGGQFQ